VTGIDRDHLEAFQAQVTGDEIAGADRVHRHADHGDASGPGQDGLEVGVGIIGHDPCLPPRDARKKRSRPKTLSASHGTRDSEVTYGSSVPVVVLQTWGFRRSEKGGIAGS